MSVVIAYSLFALLAIAANVLSQEASLLLYRGPGELWLSIPTGTAVGLVVKYVLDRKYIFRANTVPLAQDGRQFMAYTATGVITTCLFWGSEILFDQLFATREARYVGAVLGLSAGYLLKYRLDKRFVFTRVRPS
ncbi:MAG: GtrA family protein [Pseudomonadales bacterium]|nr:GtrA family protein [Pseudomonadales bacterium]MCP5357991.1 GtrA family protein [Pseudomonadales bacterium]